MIDSHSTSEIINLLRAVEAEIARERAAIENGDGWLHRWCYSTNIGHDQRQINMSWVQRSGGSISISLVQPAFSMVEQACKSQAAMDRLQELDDEIEGRR